GAYAVLPLSVFFTVSIQPDGPSLTFAFAALYHLILALRPDARAAVLLKAPIGKHEAAFLFFTTLLLLTKVSNAYVGAPLAYLLVSSAGWRSLLRPRTWIWGAIILLLTAAWYYYAKHSSSWTFGIWDDHARDNKWSNWKNISDVAAWRRI